MMLFRAITSTATTAVIAALSACTQMPSSLSAQPAAAEAADPSRRWLRSAKPTWLRTRLVLRQTLPALGPADRRPNSRDGRSHELERTCADAAVDPAAGLRPPVTSGLDAGPGLAPAAGVRADPGRLHLRGRQHRLPLQPRGRFARISGAGGWHRPMRHPRCLADGLASRLRYAVPIPGFHNSGSTTAPMGATPSME